MALEVIKIEPYKRGVSNLAIICPDSKAFQMRAVCLLVVALVIMSVLFILGALVLGSAVLAVLVVASLLTFSLSIQPESRQPENRPISDLASKAVLGPCQTVETTQIDRKQILVTVNGPQDSDAISIKIPRHSKLTLARR